MLDDPNERYPVVDEQGRVLGSITRREAHSGTRVLHPVVHLHLFNSRGELYLQRRPLWKDIQPGMWDTAVGGHVAYGESVADALARETQEEIGLTGLHADYLGMYVFEGKRERELVYVHRATSDEPPRPSRDELDDARFWSAAEIADNIGHGVFTPNFEDEYTRRIKQ